MGTIKGRIGDNVLYVSKGEQNIIKYQKNVTNPRSNGQMYQRARFSNAGRFFTRGRKAFFKFAFENKKGSQSDFNAFMKANINRSVLISKSALQIEGYPAIGKFIMCQGSLSAVSNRVVNDYWQASFGIPAQSTNPTTVGELSQLLINTNTYEQGDILTFVFLNTSSAGYIPAVKPQGNYSTDWTIKQFRINIADSTLLADFGMRAASRSWENRQLMTLTDLEDEQMLTSAYGGFVCVHSRNTAGALKVSTQELAVGESMQDAIDVAMGDDYIAQVIEDWKSTDVVQVAPDAVLKGSISFAKTKVEDVTLVSDTSSVFVLDGTNFVASEDVEEGESGSVGYIEGQGITEGQFQAALISGEADSEITFNQDGDNRVQIVYEAHGYKKQRSSFRILMRYNGVDVPIANVSFTIADVTTINVSVENNPYTLENVPPGETQSSDDMNIEPPVGVKEGDIITAKYRVKFTDAANSYEVNLSTNPLTTLDRDADWKEIGQEITGHGWITIDGGIAGLNEGNIYYLNLSLQNTSNSTSSWILTLLDVRIKHSDGSVIKLNFID